MESKDINIEETEQNLSKFNSELAIGRINITESDDIIKFSTRLKTFKDWPPSIPISAEEMAHAGFVYSGKSDEVHCFSCLLKLNNFKFDDDPLMEHVYNAPVKCQYLKLTVGHDPGLIAKIQRKRYMYKYSF